MKRVSDRIANMLGAEGIIQVADIERCKYGIDIFLGTFVEIISILIISIFVGNFVETLLMFTAFIPLRIYAGGYHADTRLRCYLISLGMYIIFTLSIHFMPQTISVMASVLCTIFSLIGVWFVAPIIHCNKKVNKMERKVYRKISIVICFSETAIILILTAIVPANVLIVSFAFGQVAVVLSMIVAIMKNMFCNTK